MTLIFIKYYLNNNSENNIKKPSRIYNYSPESVDQILAVLSALAVKILVP